MDFRPLWNDGVVLSVRYIGRAAGVNRSDHTLCRDTWNFCRYFYVTGGSISFRTPLGFEGAAGPGDVVYLPCGCGYQSRWGRVGEASFITLQFTLTGRGGAPVTLNDDICVCCHDDGEILKTLLDLLEACGRSEPGYQLRLRSGFYEVSRQLLSARPAVDPKPVERAVATLESAFMYNTDSTRTAYLAKQCAMCESEFRRAFKAETGMAPQRYKNWLRIKKARELIESGVSVSLAGESVGIGDPAYFNKLFHQFCGISPSASKKS